MQFILFICNDPSGEPYSHDDDNIEEWVSELDASGARLSGDRLGPVQDAITVRVRDGKVRTTDGPFTESKEWIGGFDLLECASREEAVEIASRHPMARFGCVEVRAFWPMSEE